VEDIILSDIAISFQKEGFIASETHRKRNIVVPALGGSLTILLGSNSVSHRCFRA
jgi:hypothetical protein